MRRFLAFILGMIVGIVFILGAIVGVIYIAVAVIHPKQVMPESEKFIGDFADMSVLDMAKSVQQLYLSKIGVADENGNYFSLGEFLENYNINVKDAFGIDIPQDVLDIPAFEFFDGDAGMDNAMKQIKVSSIPSIVNLFGAKDENGNSNGPIASAAVTELSNYSLYDLLKDENKGLPYVFQNVKFADVLQDLFPSQDGDNKLMWAVGQSSIGKLIGGVSGENNILMQLKPDGAFAALGALSILDIVGDGGQYLNAVFGDTLTADLIDDNGELNLDGVINGISVGELLGCQRNELTDTEGFTDVIKDNDGNVLLKLKRGADEKSTYAKLADGKYYEAELTCADKEHVHGNDCALACAVKEHTHGIDCYGLVWYSTAACDNDAHNHESELYLDGVYYPKTDGLYTVLANTSIADLTGGDSNALFDKIKTLKIGDMLGNNEVTGVMSNFTDMTIDELMNGAVDELFLGAFFGFERIECDASGYDAATTTPLYYKENLIEEYPVYYARFNAEGVILSTDQEVWYTGKFECDNDNHTDATHIASCYGFLWYTECDSQHGDGGCEDDTLIKEKYYKQASGIQGKLANKQVRNLQDLNDEIKKLTLFDVLGDAAPNVLKEIVHTPIGELNDAINKMYLGGLLQYQRDEFTVTAADDGSMTVTDGETSYSASTNDVMRLDKKGEVVGYAMNLGDVIAMSEDGKNWYRAILTCNDESHTKQHLTRDCYAYVWYDGEGDDRRIVEGMMAKLSEKRVDEMGQLNETIKTFTIRDVLGDDIPEMLLPLADCEIGNLKTEIDNLYIGDVLKDKRREITNADTYEFYTSGGGLGVSVAVRVLDGQYAMNDGDEKWYEAELICNDITHDTHNIDCFQYVWYEKCQEETHENCEESVEIDGAVYHKLTGLTKHIATIKIGGLNSKTLSNAINDMTLGEILEMDAETNRILYDMKDIKIGDLGKEMNNVYLGSAMNYVRNPLDDAEYTYVEGLQTVGATASVKEKSAVNGKIYVKSDNGKTWYEATFTCIQTDESHKHTADCYEYVWYVRCENATHGTCQNDTVINGLHYNPVTGITKAFVNSRIREVSKTIDEMTIRKLGIEIEDNNLLKAIQDTRLNELGSSVNNVKMGIVMGYERGEVICETDHNHNDNCDYAWLDKKGAKIIGINAKISNKTVGDLSDGTAIINIATSLTMQDMLDTGMLSLSPENEAKLNALFGDESWKEILLTDFVNELLDCIKTVPSA